MIPERKTIVVEASLHRRVKLAAILQGKTIIEFVHEALGKEVELVFSTSITSHRE